MSEIKYYYKNRRIILDKARLKYQARKRNRAVELAQSLKSGKCVDCGGTFHHAAMDFDHRDGTEKIAMVSAMIWRCSNMETIRREIAKCDLVCSNCHRVRTYRRNERTREERFAAA